TAWHFPRSRFQTMTWKPARRSVPTMAPPIRPAPRTATVEARSDPFTASVRHRPAGVDPELGARDREVLEHEDREVHDLLHLHEPSGRRPVPVGVEGFGLAGPERRVLDD